MDLTKYCGDVLGYREHFSTPFNVDDRTIATNGHIFVSIPASDDFKQCPDDSTAIAVRKMLAYDGAFTPIPKDIALPEKRPCKTCKGTGRAAMCDCDECDGEGEVELESDYNTYSCECKSCGGDGRRITLSVDTDCADCDGHKETYRRGSHVTLLGLHIDPTYLQKIMDIGDVDISADVHKKCLYFKKGDVFGGVMGMNI